MGLCCFKLWPLLWTQLLFKLGLPCSVQSFVTWVTRRPRFVHAWPRCFWRQPFFMKQLLTFYTCTKYWMYVAKTFLLMNVVIKEQSVTKGPAYLLTLYWGKSFVMQVETCNRFLSLTSKLVACNVLRNKRGLKEKPVDCPNERVDFYNMFSTLIRMGSCDKQNDKNPRRHVSWTVFYF